MARRGTKSRDSCSSLARRRARPAGVPAVGAHLAAGAAGHGRRGRDERLRRADRAADGPPRDRGRDLHPGDVVGAPAGGGAGAGRAGAPRRRRARSRGWARTTCPASCARSPRGCCAPRPGTSPAGTTSCTRTTGSPGRSAGWPGTAGACRSCTPRTPWPGSRTPRWPTGDPPEPMVRVIGEDQVVAEADRLVCNTGIEARELVDLYGADPARIVTIPPGVDLARFRPGDRAAARRALGDRPGRRGARLRRPDPAAEGPGRAAARRGRAAASATPALRSRLVVLVAGGPSGSGLAEPTGAAAARRPPGARRRRALPPAAGRRTGSPTVFRAADVVAVPSHNESFGLVALEAQACGTPGGRRAGGRAAGGGGGRAVGAARRRAPGGAVGGRAGGGGAGPGPARRRCRAGRSRTRSGSPGTGRRTRCWPPTTRPRRSSPERQAGGAARGGGDVVSARCGGRWRPPRWPSRGRARGARGRASSW